MGSVWCVKPETVKVDLEWVDHEGVKFPFWIEVKKRLTVGEARRAATGGWRGVSGGQKAADKDAAPEITIDWQVQTFARTEAYLTDWSLEDEHRKRLPLTRDQIEALDPDVYELIENAITKHVEAMADEKKAQSGKRKPSAMSA